jgi:hypothetical protein
MLGIGGPIALGNIGLSPRAIGVGTLPGRGIGSGVGIIGLGGAPGAVRAIGRRPASVGPSVRIVIGTCGGPIVRTINTSTGSIRTSIRIIVGACAIGNRIRVIIWVTVAYISDLRRVIIAGAIRQNRADRGGSDKCSQIARGITCFYLTLGIRRLLHVSNVINR